MARGGIKTIIQDGSLGGIGVDASGVFGAVGIASKGVDQGIFVLSSPQDAREKLGTGALVDAIVSALSIARTTCYAVALSDASVANVLSAVDLLLASSYDFEWISIADVSASPVWVTLASRADSAADEGRYIHFKAQARYLGADESVDQWVTALSGGERGSSISSRVQVYAGWVNNVNDSGDLVRQSGVGIASGMSARREAQEPVDATSFGVVPGVSEILPAKLTGAHIDALDNAGYATFCTYPGKRGIYVTHGRMLAGLTSDFGTEERRRVMDYACRRVREAQFRYINSTVEIGADGSMEGLEMFKAVSAQPLNIMANDGMISEGEIILDPNGDILATETVLVRVRIRPLGKMSWIENTISYYNPNIGDGS